MKNIDRAELCSLLDSEEHINDLNNKLKQVFDYVTKKLSTREYSMESFLEFQRTYYDCLQFNLRHLGYCYRNPKIHSVSEKEMFMHLSMTYLNDFFDRVDKYTKDEDKDNETDDIGTMQISYDELQDENEKLMTDLKNKDQEIGFAADALAIIASVSGIKCTLDLNKVYKNTSNVGVKIACSVASGLVGIATGKAIAKTVDIEYSRIGNCIKKCSMFCKKIAEHKTK